MASFPAPGSDAEPGADAPTDAPTDAPVPVDDGASGPAPSTASPWPRTATAAAVVAYLVAVVAAGGASAVVGLLRPREDLADLATVELAVPLVVLLAVHVTLVTVLVRRLEVPWEMQTWPFALDIAVRAIGAGIAAGLGGAVLGLVLVLAGVVEPEGAPNIALLAGVAVASVLVTTGLLIRLGYRRREQQGRTSASL